MRDIQNQSSYQSLFRDAGCDAEPFVGLIVGPYDQALPAEQSNLQFFYTREEGPSGGAAGMPVHCVASFLARRPSGSAVRSPVRNITPRSRGASPLSLTRSLPPFRAPPLSSVAAASLAIVATAGIAAVHPSAGGVIVSSSSRLGQSDAEHPHDHGALDHANHPVDDVSSIEATSPDDPTADSSEMTEAAHMYDDLVEHPHAARAANRRRTR